MIKPGKEELSPKETKENRLSDAEAGEEVGEATPEKPSGKAKRRRPTPKKAVEGGASSKGAVWTFPKHSLEKAISIARAIEEKNAGKPLPAQTLAEYLGRSLDWRFLDFLRSANLYGLVSGSGAQATISLEQTGEDIVAPSSPGQRQAALQAAFEKVELFKRVRDFYAGKRLPEDEYFANTLTREFGVPRDRVGPFIEVFTENLNFLRAFAPGAERGTTVKKPISQGPGSTEPRDEPPPQDGVREFLDTCFVLMPFGDWYDRYYREIYGSAIKAAGLEPVRADSLFSTGSVMEQIWDQIRKSAVLLAELTEKNANVFYELGLAHAIGKAVVIVSGNLDDVPFDLRHLRVITYEVREPNWAEKLRNNITEYLKSAKLDPAKSIPQPFRDSVSKQGALESAVTDLEGPVRSTSSN